MPEQIYIGNFMQGQTTSRLPFNIDNDAFPSLVNSYCWRGRVKRKRGTYLLGQLELQFSGTFVLAGGAANLITQLSLPATSTITPGSISFVLAGNTYTEPATPDGTLVGVPAGTGTIDYATGAVTIAGGGGGTVTAIFSYFPGLPVMGLEDFVAVGTSSNFPLLLAFDTEYSYQINQTGASVNFYNVNYYKDSDVPFLWSAADYQLFWTTNYASALWATNNVPGLNFLNGTYSAGTGTATITFNFKSSGVNFKTLVVGDKLWFNEWNTGGSTLNGLLGTVSSIAGAAAGNYVVTFGSSPTAAGTGIVQLLTNTIPGQDGIKWYDGDPTSGTGLPTATGMGWVNFAPPLTASAVSIDNTPAALYYLVGALAIVPFKDRLLFFSPWIQTSSGAPIQLQDTALWSWNGTPYYTSLTPAGETFDVRAYYVDETGFGGYLPAGISQPIATVSNNEDVLLVGFGGQGRKTRFVYTGNDLQPFLFFNINSELPSTSTFSSVTLDQGAIDIGTYGICMTDQQSAQRIDLPIPDAVFQIQTLNNGVQRVNSARDFQREWIYFSFPYSTSPWKFPTQTFLFNYRDTTWSVLYENFTVHGNYRKQKKYSWLTIPFASWEQWQEPWNGGSTTPLIPNIVAGNPQGYVLVIGQGTGEGASGTISAISNNGGLTQITSTNHCVTSSNPLTKTGDYLLFQNAIGSTYLNGLIGQVTKNVDANNFVVDIPFQAGTYLGLGQYVRLSQPLIQTKQFPIYWQEGRQTRLAVQKYLMDYTPDGQVTVNINLSMDPTSVWNSPSYNPPPNSLVYTQLLYTCPESTNIGLTPSNTNLQMPTAESQFQIWHRLNTSLIGDTVQIGITLSDAQMRNYQFATSEIALHGIQLTVDRGPQLC